MNPVGDAEIEVGGFGASRERFTTVLAFLDGAEAAAASHAELEENLQVASRELFRQLSRTTWTCGRRGSSGSRSSAPTVWPGLGSRPGTSGR